MAIITSYSHLVDAYRLIHTSAHRNALLASIRDDGQIRIVNIEYLKIKPQCLTNRWFIQGYTQSAARILFTLMLSGFVPTI